MATLVSKGGLLYEQSIEECYYFTFDSGLDCHVSEEGPPAMVVCAKIGECLPDDL